MNHSFKFLLISHTKLLFVLTAQDCTDVEWTTFKVFFFLSLFLDNGHGHIFIENDCTELYILKLKYFKVIFAYGHGKLLNKKTSYPIKATANTQMKPWHISIVLFKAEKVD